MSGLPSLSTIEDFRQAYCQRFATVLGISEDEWAAQLDRLRQWEAVVKVELQAMHRQFLDSCVNQEILVFENTRRRTGHVVRVDHERDVVRVRMPEGDEHDCEDRAGRYVHTEEDCDSSYSLVWEWANSTQYREFREFMKRFVTASS